MATFLPSVTGTGYDTVQPFQPDFSFLSNVLQTKEQQYQQGLSQVQQGYAAMVNAPLSSFDNINKRKEYINSAQKGLQKVSTTDLSLTKNTSQADMLYAPFWSDDKMLYDQGLTKKYQQQKQRGLAASLSTNKEVRDSFDPRSIELLDLQINRLQNARRDDPDFMSIEVDDWHPFVKVQNYLDAHKTADKFEVKMDIPTPDGRILTVKNGPGSIPNARTYADGILGDQLNDQYNLLGKLSKERQVKQYIDAFPGSTRQQAIERIGQFYYPQIQETYKQNIGSIKHTIDTKSMALKNLNDDITKNGGTPTEEQAYNKRVLETEIASYVNRKNSLEKNANDFNSPTGYNEFIVHPEAAIGMIERTKDIDKWALSFAANEERSWKSDEAYWNNAREWRERKALNETIRNNKEDQRIGWYNAETGRMNAETNRIELGLKYAATDPNGGTSWGGKSTSEEFHMDATERANAKVQMLHDQVTDLVYNPSTIGAITQYIPTNLVPQGDQLKFLDFMGRYQKGGITEFTDDKGIKRLQGMTPDEHAAYSRMSNFLTNETGMKISNPDDANKAFLAYTAKELNHQRSIGAGNSELNKQIGEQYKQVKENMSLLDRDAAERKRGIDIEIKNNPDRYKEILVNGRLITGKDIAPVISRMNLVSTDGTALPVQQFSEDYVRGRVEKRALQSGQTALIHNGKMYVIPYKFDQFAKDTPSDLLMTLPSSEEMGSKRNALEHSVVSQTSLASNKENQLGDTWNMDLDEKKGTNYKKLRELVDVSNTDGMFFTDAGHSALTPEQQTAVRDIINSKDYEKYLGTTYKYYTSAFYGKPGAVITIASVPEGKDGEEKVPGAKGLIGKHILIQRSHTAQGTYLSTLPVPHDYSMHKLNRGEGVYSDLLQDATGMSSYTILPFPAVNPTQYVIDFTKHLKSPTTGQDTTVTTRRYLPANSTNPYQLQRDMDAVQQANGVNYFQNDRTHKANINKKH